MKRRTWQSDLQLSSNTFCKKCLKVIFIKTLEPSFFPCMKLTLRPLDPLNPLVWDYFTTWTSHSELPFFRRLESPSRIPGRKRWTSTCKSCGRLWMVTLQIWKNWGWPHPDVELGSNFEWGKRPSKPQISRLLLFLWLIALKSVAELYWWTRGGGQGAWDWLALLTSTDQEVFCCFFFQSSGDVKLKDPKFNISSRKENNF